MRTEVIQFQQTLAALQGVQLGDFSPITGRIVQVTFHFPPGCNALVDVAFGIRNTKQVCPATGFIALDAATPFALTFGATFGSVVAFDGIVGPATLAAMNISAQERVDQIRVNLERMRWVYDELPGDLLLVDIAGQQVQLLRDEKPVWKSRVIVGRTERPTPIFRDQVEYLEINPNWTVPPTILEKDILPAMRKDPGYLKKKGLKAPIAYLPHFVPVHVLVYNLILPFDLHRNIRFTAAHAHAP